MKFPVTVSLKAQTPLWTGGADKDKMTCLRATSILGGLRFWSESLLRSLGYPVCYEQDRCIQDQDKPLVCSCCRLFGCTGLSRAFSLKVEDNEALKFSKGRKIIFRHLQHRDRLPTWFLKPGIQAGHTFKLRLTPLRPADNQDTALAALYLLIHWGALGAQDQYGYGFVAPVDENADFFEKVRKITLQEDSPRTTDKENHRVSRPDLRDFFFFSGKIKERNDPVFNDIIRNGGQCNYPDDVPIELRCAVRSRLRPQNGNRQAQELRHQFCGNVMGGTSHGSRYNLTQLNGKIYGWGWYPRNKKQNADRDQCLNALQEELGRICTATRWKEFDSQRDNESSAEWNMYLNELIANPWR